METARYRADIAAQIRRTEDEDIDPQAKAGERDLRQFSTSGADGITS
jgi:hypothetical protein